MVAADVVGVADDSAAGDCAAVDDDVVADFADSVAAVEWLQVFPSGDP